MLRSLIRSQASRGLRVFKMYPVSAAAWQAKPVAAGVASTPLHSRDVHAQSSILRFKPLAQPILSSSFVSRAAESHSACCTEPFLFTRAVSRSTSIRSNYSTTTCSSTESQQRYVLLPMNTAQLCSNLTVTLLSLSGMPRLLLSLPVRRKPHCRQAALSHSKQMHGKT